MSCKCISEIMQLFHAFVRIWLITLSLVNAYFVNSYSIFVSLDSVYMVLKHRRRSEVFILFS